ncbi:Hypothetical_protein [Hexamita inflata]|uniref:Hypothetical_protein n=1 Tax=Hexamita inflata TaxID=28002 RepID=A0AA86TWF1_9EUKA|nr:Hypothetical protein HINF_LOCUS19320 [Hexamita inflata]
MQCSENQVIAQILLNTYQKQHNKYVIQQQLINEYNSMRNVKQSTDFDECASPSQQQTATGKVAPINTTSIFDPLFQESKPTEVIESVKFESSFKPTVATVKSAQQLMEEMRSKCK